MVLNGLHKYHFNGIILVYQVTHYNLHNILAAGRVCVCMSFIFLWLFKNNILNHFLITDSLK